MVLTRKLRSSCKRKDDFKICWKILNYLSRREKILQLSSRHWNIKRKFWTKISNDMRRIFCHDEDVFFPIKYTYHIYIHNIYVIISLAPLNAPVCCQYSQMDSRKTLLHKRTPVRFLHLLRLSVHQWYYWGHREGSSYQNTKKLLCRTSNIRFFCTLSRTSNTATDLNPFSLLLK